MVALPSRPLLKISSTLIAYAWKENDLGTIRTIYDKSCLNQFIIGGFLFLGIWANIDNILIILGEDYLQSKWIIFFIGLGYLVDMATGANSQIISLSNYYRMSFYFMVVLVVLMVTLLFLLIPVFGLTGAAISVSSALCLNNLMRYLFLLKKFGLQPFNIRFPVILIFFTGLYLLLKLIPQLPLIPDILIRGSSITIATGLFVWLSPISPDMQKIGKEILIKFKGAIDEHLGKY